MQKIEYIKIDKLKLHPENPRIIKDIQFKKLCDSIKGNPDYFETRPILCNTEKVIFAGNMRWRAAKEIGMKDVPVAVMDIPIERQREIMIRDNHENGEWDFDTLANTFDFEELVNWGFDRDGLRMKFSLIGVSDEDVEYDRGKYISKKPFKTLEEAIKAANQYQSEVEVEYGLDIRLKEKNETKR